MSSVILSTWVITLSTLSRYLPQHGINVFVKDLMLKEVLSSISYITCYNHNCAGTGNIHAMRFRNKIESIPCVFIIQSHSYLFVNFFLEIQYM